MSDLSIRFDLSCLGEFEILFCDLLELDDLEEISEETAQELERN